jgi:hypothetical protein
MHFSVLAAFAVALAIAVALPGPGIFAVVSCALGRGLRDALALIGGIILGDLIYFYCAVLGMAALARSMGEFFIVVKFAGAAYLVWLGIRLWREKPADPAAVDRPAGARDGGMWVRKHFTPSRSSRSSSGQKLCHSLLPSTTCSGFPRFWNSTSVSGSHTSPRCQISSAPASRAGRSGGYRSCVSAMTAMRIGGYCAATVTPEPISIVPAVRFMSRIRAGLWKNRRLPAAATA